MIRYRLDDIEHALSGWTPIPVKVETSELLALPDHLRKTMIVVISKGECSAAEVSNVTGRHRAVESMYLNQMQQQRLLTSRKIGRQKFFRKTTDANKHTREKPTKNMGKPG